MNKSCLSPLSNIHILKYGSRNLNKVNKEIGIKPYEQIENVNKENYFTITIVIDNSNKAKSYWGKLSNRLKQNFPYVVKWHTLGSKIQSRTQEYVQLKKYRKGLEKENFIQKNDRSNIYSSIEEISNIVEEYDLDRLTWGRYTCLLFLRDKDLRIEDIWTLLKDNDNELLANGIEKILNYIPNNVLVCRFYEHNDEYAIQIIGESSLLKTTSETIN